MKEERTGGRKEREIESRREFAGESRESTRTYKFSNQGKVSFNSNNCLLSLTTFRFIELERRRRDDTTRYGIVAHAWTITPIHENFLCF